MQCGELSAPFDVVHDTHSDLAFGPPGTDLLKAVLTRRPDARGA